MNGVTGRMGRAQHLARSVAAIRSQGGLQVGEVTVWPDPILVGRDARRLQALADQFGVEHVSVDLDSCLADSDYEIYFDAQTTSRREKALEAAISAGKAVYCEKPAAASTESALRLARQAERAHVPHGVVQDKLFLPGLLKLADVLSSGQLGDVLSVDLQFGYWVFADLVGSTQRPSWNYRAEDGGGIVLDMFCHFRYLFDNLFGGVRSVVCTKALLTPSRLDEQGREYAATADDAAYALVELANGAVARVTASWCVRPYRDDLFVVQVDGAKGSAVADLRRCQVQFLPMTPRFTWDPDSPQGPEPRRSWALVPDRQSYPNAFRHQWELFIRHVVNGEPFPWDLREAARGVQFAEVALRSAKERRWLDVPELI